MSATRVMATCATLGQAVGTAASIALTHGVDPRGVYERGLVPELQQTLMEDDCYLPWHVRQVPRLSRLASLSASAGNPEPLRNGIDRPVEDSDNGWAAPLGAWVQYTLPEPTRIRRLRFVFDSDLNRPEMNQPANYPLDMPTVGVPRTLVRSFKVEARDQEGQWREIARVDNNYQRLVRLEVDVVCDALRFTPESTWGSPNAHLFAWDITD